jgi:adenine deaminase
VRLPSITKDSFAIPATAGSIRVIEIIPGQLLTNSQTFKAASVEGLMPADPGRDLAKIAVIERHHATGRIGLGFVTGFGLRRGAFASTVAHDAHNVVVVGASDDDMAVCALRLQEMGGGIVVAAEREVLAELPLAVAGLLSEEPFETVVDRLDQAHSALGSLGVETESPFMTLSFLALSVIPKLKITDRGLVDVDQFRLVPLEMN